MKTRTIVFDLEIQKLIVAPLDQASAEEIDLVNEGQAVHGWENAKYAGISSAVAYEVERDRYYIYGDRPEEHLDLVNLLGGSDQVIGFNHIRFDYALLAESTDLLLAAITDLDAAPGERDIDLLQMIWAGLGKRDFAKGNGLDAVSLATLGKELGGKNGHGAHAPALYQAGRYGGLINYNLRDVELTARLHRFIHFHGYCITGAGRTVRPVHPRQWF